MADHGRKPPVSSDEPSTKKFKKSTGIQSNLFTFFASNVPVPPKKIAAQSSQSADNAADTSQPATDKVASDTVTSNGVPDPIVPVQVATPRNVMWQSIHESYVIIRKPSGTEPRKKVAAFDFDGTLVAWSASLTGFWPSQLSHYELWASTVPAKLRALHDDGYKLVLFSNQGAVQKAHSGKKAMLVKNVMDWIAGLVDRPVHAVLSTRSPKKAGEDSFHKPSPKMWQVATQYLNKRQEFDLASSFFVGDSADPNDEQGGVDFKFAKAVSEKYGQQAEVKLKFHTPTEYFGPSDSERRKRQDGLSNQLPPPKEALEARSALLGGYHKGPILLILCGVQGSGKSTFCNELDQDSANSGWVVLSQDTINKGKPGKREKVEEEATTALKRGKSVVVDRMHLDPEQRGHFVSIAKSLQVPAHVVLLNPPREVIGKRVRERVNHPGKVQGDDGARRALQSLDKLVLPTYEEGVQLINCASLPTTATRLAQLYKAVTAEGHAPQSTESVFLSESLSYPAITLGTMGVGKRMAKEVLLAATSAGIRAVDTAPTYKNEDKVGEALAGINQDIKCICKIPKSAVQAADVRHELDATLKNLKRQSAEILLLHWPCDVVASGTLADVWKEMENCVKEGRCQAIGVCNFNVDALALLLANCSIPPVINQVERHPLLSQMDLVDFCARNNIQLQAHTPLGQGKPELLEHDVVVDIGKQTSMSPAQVVLQWNIQQGMMVVPRCRSEEHVKQVLRCNKLSPKQMELLDGLNCGKRFVTPPFMYGSSSYCWSDRMPRK